ncbi:hypothetical protein ACFWUZ_12020 [Streptomyces sp. NPDC058646]
MTSWWPVCPTADGPSAVALRTAAARVSRAVSGLTAEGAVHGVREGEMP